MTVGDNIFSTYRRIRIVRPCEISSCLPDGVGRHRSQRPMLALLRASRSDQLYCPAQSSVSIPGQGPLTRSSCGYTEHSNSVSRVRRSTPGGVACGQSQSRLQTGLCIRLQIQRWTERLDSKPVYEQLTNSLVSVSGTRPIWHEETAAHRAVSVVAGSHARRSFLVISIGERQAITNSRRTLPTPTGAQRVGNE